MNIRGCNSWFHGVNSQPVSHTCATIAQRSKSTAQASGVQTFHCKLAAPKVQHTVRRGSCATCSPTVVVATVKAQLQQCQFATRSCNSYSDSELFRESVTVHAAPVPVVQHSATVANARSSSGTARQRHFPKAGDCESRHPVEAQLRCVSSSTCRAPQRTVAAVAGPAPVAPLAPQEAVSIVLLTAV